MQLKNLYIVTYPKPGNTLSDICIKVSVPDGLGVLRGLNIYAVYAIKQDAVSDAKRLLLAAGLLPYDDWPHVDLEKL